MRAFIARGAEFEEPEFNRLALRVFAAQFEATPIYNEFCRQRKATPERVEDWRQIPPLPTSAFKEFEVTSIPDEERTRVFHSSGTTSQKPSRHFHHEESLALYEESLWRWFDRRFFASAPPAQLLFLTPGEAPHSSLVHMFQTVRRRSGLPSVFAGVMDAEGTWNLDFSTALDSLGNAAESIGILGTAFSFVHLLDRLAESGRKFVLPRGSRIMETGGYKGRSRAVPKAQLRRLITKFLGVPDRGIITEYGMSELGSQAYEEGGVFTFPPWARALIVSPETGRPVAEGETGLLRVFDLANVWSVMAVQTEDLAAPRAHGFELAGRLAEAEPRGCSLLAR